MREAVILDKDEDLSGLISKVRDRTGIDFSHYRETTLRRRISRRMSARGSLDLASYIRLLDCDPEEYGCLCADLTIKYSEFFRDHSVFETLNDVLAELVAGMRTCPAKLSVWSAGCATGEEVYSLAVLARKLMQSGHDNLAVKIIGTDIDPAALQTARTGVYRKDILPVPIPKWALPYFVDDGKNIRPVDNVKELAEFQQQDLLSPSTVERMRRIKPGNFDLVLCRNVLIYLKRPAQLQVLSACSKMLKPGGFLMVGNREIVPKSASDILEPYKLEHRIYRKRRQ